jgi:predicted metalloendopeptidase
MAAIRVSDLRTTSSDTSTVNGSRRPRSRLTCPWRAPPSLIVRQPSYLETLAASLDDVSLEDWRQWLRFRRLSSSAPHLSKAFVQQNFDFYSKTLTGAQEMKARWKRGVALANELLGEAVGEAYVAEHFPPAAKAQMDDLVDWWTESDKAQFTERADKLIGQYNAFEPRDLPDRTVNGALTVGENIGDLGGLTIGLQAYLISLDGADAPVIDGLTGPQRVFMSWAHIWRVKAREAFAVQLLSVDPHSPAEFRANVARNLDEFHAAFETTPDDGLWLDPADRVRIW